jgi:hypothetical protein
LYLKGGDFGQELRGLATGKLGSREAGEHGGIKEGGKGTQEQRNPLKPTHYTIYPLGQYFTENYFETKSLVYLF